MASSYRHLPRISVALFSKHFLFRFVFAKHHTALYRACQYLFYLKMCLSSTHILHVENDHHGKDTAIIAAPVALDGTQYYMGVVVSQNSEMSNMYEVHDAVVVEKQKEGNTALTKTPSAGEDQTRRGGDLPVAIILSDLANYNREFADNSQYARRDDLTRADVREILSGMEVTDRMNATEKDMLTRYKAKLLTVQDLQTQIDQQKAIIDSETATMSEKSAAKARMKIYTEQPVAVFSGACDRCHDVVYWSGIHRFPHIIHETGRFAHAEKTAAPGALHRLHAAGIRRLCGGRRHRHQ